MIEASLLILAGCIGLVVMAACTDTTPRKRVRTIIRSEHNRDIVGDGAWISPRPSAARSARVRDIEPRGA